jgi:hypothetical protein
MAKIPLKLDGLWTKIIIALLRVVLDFFDDGKINGTSNFGKSVDDTNEDI